MAILYPTSLANLVVEVGTRHCHQTLFAMLRYPTVAWWRHQMETFPRYWPCVRGIHRSPVNYPHKGQWREALMLSLISAWINGWVNNREAGDFRRHRAHYDVTVMHRNRRKLRRVAFMVLIQYGYAILPRAVKLPWIFPGTPLSFKGQGSLDRCAYQYRKSHCSDKTILRPFYLKSGSWFASWVKSWWVLGGGVLRPKTGSVKFYPNLSSNFSEN